MISLSQEQFTRFRQSSADAFYDKLRRELRDFMAEKLSDVPNDEVDARITQAFHICHQHRFWTEKEITRLSFILVTFPYAFPKMTQYQWLSGLITARASAEVRLQRIKAYITAGSKKHG
ncbi:hypothetical protein MWU61_19215 [Loktanella sp. F6476L]|uniref:hypothetical protein n=1 Tax=Loktanella sp. F6476L TaxID=2926405 RepID=UPI001FF137F1|nr:hypothetical protein [Loktanella sp. F6476L]MCK0122686.1 hypothetical protein [Loktanella sp. F6476L]